MNLASYLTATLGVAALGCCLNAQQPTCMASHPMPGMASAETLPPPSHMTGIGNAYIEISTPSPEARVWFEQGLNLLHDFWDFESIRAFQQSVTADPNCAMCWWGLHQAQSFRGTDDVQARLSLDRAKKLSKHATEPEKLYIKAALQSDKDNARSQKSTHDDENPPAKDSSETKTLRKLVALSPQDTQARIALAESLLRGFKKSGEPKSGTIEGQAILAQILKDHPEDSAANHYWIHAVEPGNHPELALESSHKLGSLAPASGHMVHMPGHIFYRVGDYEAARTSFEASLRTDEAYMRDHNIKVDDDWNYVHNMMYLIADLLEEGRIAEATSVSAKLNSARGDTRATLYVFSTRDGLTRLNTTLPVVLRSGDWSAAAAQLEASHPDPSLKNLVWLRAVLLHYTLGMKALEAADIAAASKHLDALNAALKVKPEEDMPAMHHNPGPPSKDMMSRPAHSFVDVAALELQGSLFTAQDKPAEADTAFKKATEAETALGYHEPPYYIRPVGETRGDALLRAHRFAEARIAYEQALAQRPNSGYPLAGIARAQAAANDASAATAAFARVIAAWPHADPGLPQLQEARDWIARHPESQNSEADQTPKSSSPASQ